MEGPTAKGITTKAARTTPSASARACMLSADALAFDFWKAVDACASWTTHGQNHTMLTVVGHNVGYDMLATGAYVHLPRLGWKLEHPYDKGPVFIQKMRKGQDVIQILSSLNFFTDSLKNVALTFGTEKLDMADYNTADVATLETYCRRDVEICRKAVVWLCETLYKENLGPFKATISSIAFASWRYRFMSHTVTVHTTPAAMALERKSYCGGRTEAFRIGEWDLGLTCLDINNMYGSVMVFHNLPNRLDRRANGSAGERVGATVGRGRLLIADVDVDMDERAVPRKSVKLLFPVGLFRTVLAGPELRLAFKHGRVLKVHEMATYEGAPIFKAFVECFSQKRVEAREHKQEAAYTLYKDFVNHSYGKLGQQNEEWERVGDLPLDTKPSREVLETPDRGPVIRLRMPGVDV